MSDHFLGKASLTFFKLRRTLVRYWEIIADRPVGVGAAYQRLILKVERSGLQTHIAGTESALLCTDELLTAFAELERQVLTVTFYLESIQADSCTDDQ